MTMTLLIMLHLRSKTCVMDIKYKDNIEKKLCMQGYPSSSKIYPIQGLIHDTSYMNTCKIPHNDTHVKHWNINS